MFDACWLLSSDRPT